VPPTNFLILGGGGTIGTSAADVASGMRASVTVAVRSGIAKALRDDAGLRNALNVRDGRITCGPVADAPGLPYAAPEAVL